MQAFALLIGLWFADFLWRVLFSVWENMDEWLASTIIRLIMTSSYLISRILRYLKVFKQAHLVRDNEVTLYLLLLIYTEYILKVQLSYIIYLLTNQGPSIILNDGVLYNYWLVLYVFTWYIYFLYQVNRKGKRQ